MDDEVNDFLEHYGVRGQKWGVRRGRDGVRPAVARRSGITNRGSVVALLGASVVATGLAGYGGMRIGEFLSRR